MPPASARNMWAGVGVNVPLGSGHETMWIQQSPLDERGSSLAVRKGVDRHPTIVLGTDDRNMLAYSLKLAISHWDHKYMSLLPRELPYVA